VSMYKPGDKVTVTYIRNKKENTVTVSLKNRSGNYDIVHKDNALSALGAEFVTLESRQARDYGIKGGVVVKRILPGAIEDQTRMKDGFIILKVNEKDVNSVEEMSNAIRDEKIINITGFYPGYDGVYEYRLSL